MIKSVTVINHTGDSIKLELTRPELSGFAIVNIEGLGPVKADISISDISTYDGGLYNSSRLGTRNIVLSIIFMNYYGESIEDIRHRAYTFFQTKTKVKLLFETSTRNLEIDGYVESNEPTIFSKQEGCTISVLCPFPYMYSLEEDSSITFSNVDPMFEFPFSNESLTDPLLELGHIKDVTEKVIEYKGDAETGIKIKIHAYGDVGSITIYNMQTKESMKINATLIEQLSGAGISANDEIIINTNKGDKYVRLLRNGVYYNILNCLDKNACWFQLKHGDNIFAYTAESGVENLKFTIENRVIYKGV